MYMHINLNKKVIILLLVLLFLIGLFFLITTPSQKISGFDEQVSVSNSLSGTLSFKAYAEGDESKEIKTFYHHFDKDFTSSFAYTEISDRKDAVFFVEQPENQIIIISDSTIFENAWHPYYSESENALFFMNDDGISKYSLEDKETVLVSDLYTGLTPVDSFTYSESERTIVFISPQRHLLSVQSLDNEVLKEVGHVINSKITYSNPTISPDGASYAVLEKGADDYSIKIRQLRNPDAVKTISLNRINGASVQLEGWSTGVVWGE